MKKQKKDKPIIPENNNLNQVPQIENEEQLRLSLLLGPDERASKLYSDKSFDEKNLTFELLSGRRTSINEERELRKRILAESAINHKPKFVEFFIALGNLLGWSEDVMKAFRKPHIAPLIINAVIYGMFTKGVMEYIHKKNPYVRYCIRKRKNYHYLNAEGILLLEIYIYNAITLMKECKSYDEFRYRHASLYGGGYQADLFKQF